MPFGLRNFLRVVGAFFTSLAAPGPVFAAEAPQGRRIIDVHMHAYPATMPIVRSANPISVVKSAIRNGAEHYSACVAEMKRHNVVRGIVSGGDGDRLQAAIDWREHDPDRFV